MYVVVIVSRFWRVAVSTTLCPCQSTCSHVIRS